MLTERDLEKIEYKLDCVRHYSPTVPLNYQEYHEIIYDLIATIRKMRPLMERSYIGENI